MKLRILISTTAMMLSASAAHAYVGGDDAYCREFTKTIYVGGRAQQGYGTSCMQPDGSWQIVQEPRVQSASYYAPPPAQYAQPVQYGPMSAYGGYHAYPRPCHRPQAAWPLALSFNYSNWDNNWHHRRHDRHHGWRDHGRRNDHANHRDGRRGGGNRFAGNDWH